MNPWFLLYDGTSEDGRGTGRYAGRTTDESVARRHYEACQANPYSVGYVEIVTDTAKWRWSSTPGYRP